MNSGGRWKPGIPTLLQLNRTLSIIFSSAYEEIAFIDHLLGIIPLTSLDGCQDCMTMYSAWCPILPQYIFISFSPPSLDNWYQYCRSKEAAWICTTTLLSSEMLGSLGMEPSGICPWLCGPCRYNEMKALEKAGEKREEIKQELQLYILLPHHGHNVKSTLRIYFIGTTMCMHNWLKAISMMNPSILTTILISVGMQVGNGFFIPLCPYYFGCCCLCHARGNDFLSFKKKLKKKKRWWCIIPGLEEVRFTFFSANGVCLAILKQRDIPHLWNLNRRAC